MKVKEYLKPRNLSKLRTFLGCGYNRKFIWNFTNIAQPLSDLTSQRTTWQWTLEREETFEQLKLALTRTPALVQQDAEGTSSGRRPFVIYTDTSQRGLEAVLRVEGDDTCTPCISHRAALLMLSRITRRPTRKHWLSYLRYGNSISLRMEWREWWVPTRRSDVRIECYGEIQQYKAKIEHLKGKVNSVADALSRGVPWLTQCPKEMEANERVVRVAVTEKTSEWLQELDMDTHYD